MQYENTKYGTTTAWDKARGVKTAINFQSNRERLEFIQSNYPEVYSEVRKRYLFVCIYPDYQVECQTKKVNAVLKCYFEPQLFNQLALVPELR